MKPAISLYSMNDALSSGEMNVSDVLDFYAGIGVKHVELVDGYMPADEDKAAVLSRLKKLNMDVACYSISNNFAADGDELTRNINKVRSSVAWAWYFETNVIATLAADAAANADGKHTYEQIIDAYKQCVDALSYTDMVFALENHGTFAGKAAQVKQIIQSVDSPYLTANIDTGNFLLAGDDPAEAAHSLIDYVGHVHFKDLKLSDSGEGFETPDGKRYTGAVAGSGDVKLKKIVNLLKQKSYKGFLSLEFEGSSDNLRDDVKKSYNYLCSLL